MDKCVRKSDPTRSDSSDFPEKSTSSSECRFLVLQPSGPVQIENDSRQDKLRGYWEAREGLEEDSPPVEGSESSAQSQLIGHVTADGNQGIELQRSLWRWAIMKASLHSIAERSEWGRGRPRHGTCFHFASFFFTCRC